MFSAQARMDTDRTTCLLWKEVVDLSRSRQRPFPYGAHLALRVPPPIAGELPANRQMIPSWAPAPAATLSLPKGTYWDAFRAPRVLQFDAEGPRQWNLAATWVRTRLSA